MSPTDRDFLLHACRTRRPGSGACCGRSTARLLPWAGELHGGLGTCCLGGTRPAQGASAFFLASQAGFGWELGLYMHSDLGSLARWHVESVEMSSGVQSWEIIGSTDQCVTGAWLGNPSGPVSQSCIVHRGEAPITPRCPRAGLRSGSDVLWL